MVYGYNGALPGHAHCDEAGHLMVDGYCQRALHAEQNAIIKAARTSGVSLIEATIYTTHFPCPVCTKMLIASGIRRVFYHFTYRADLDVISEGMMRSSNVYSIQMPIAVEATP
jgi:dCMP deaminase